MRINYKLKKFEKSYTFPKGDCTFIVIQTGSVEKFQNVYHKLVGLGYVWNGGGNAPASNRVQREAWGLGLCCDNRKMVWSSGDNTTDPGYVIVPYTEFMANTNPQFLDYEDKIQS